MQQIADSIRRVQVAVAVAALAMVGVGAADDPVRNHREAVIALDQLDTLAAQAAESIFGDTLARAALDAEVLSLLDYHNNCQWDGCGPILPTGRRVRLASLDGPGLLAAISIPLLDPEITVNDVLRLSRDGFNSLGFVMVAAPRSFTQAVIAGLPEGTWCAPCEASGWLGYGGHTNSAKSVGGRLPIAHAFPPANGDPWGEWFLDLAVEWSSPTACEPSCIASVRRRFNGSLVYDRPLFRGTALQRRAERILSPTSDSLAPLRALQHEIGNLTASQARSTLSREIDSRSRTLNVLGVSFHNAAVASGGTLAILALLAILLSNLQAVERRTEQEFQPSLWLGPTLEDQLLGRILSLGAHVLLPAAGIVAVATWSWPFAGPLTRALVVLGGVGALCAGIKCEAVTGKLRLLRHENSVSRTAS